MAQNFNLGEFAQFVTTNVTSNAITFVANTTQLVFANNIAITANGSNGSSGQALTTNGSAVYWSTIVGTNTAAQYTWTNTHSFTNTTTSGNATSGAVTIAGGLGVANNIYTAGRVGFSNASNISVGYLQYNVATGSIDLVFG